jgi:predicted RNase H-like nuclease (RuvC/YqgF family)
MSDNPTREMPDSRSFEERVFASFDALDARLSSLESKVDGLDGRLISLEEKVDARLRETRPIWEAQADLESVKGEVREINRNMKVLHKDVLRVRVDRKNCAGAPRSWNRNRPASDSPSSRPV